jgi:aminopeptidase N
MPAASLPRAWRTAAAAGLIAAATATAADAQRDIYDSGGPLSPEQAAYDTRYYDLALRVSPADSSIGGTLTVVAEIVHPTEWLVLDLDTLLHVSSVTDEEGAGPVRFERRVGQIWLHLERVRQPGEQVRRTVHYAGRPRVAPMPPWQGGFTWSRTEAGEPWIATSNQGQGADLWWPVKDHVSDKPDSVSIRIRVPEPLVVASNGRLRGVEAHGDGTRTHHWFVSTPISTYNVALNIAPYRLIEEAFTSVAGDRFPVQFYVLPESHAQGLALFPEILDHLRFFEELLGPYPFRADKYGVAQTPHLGMEHQTIIAYGANFDNRAMTGGVDWGFDALHHHELAHEWWGNLVTNPDWNDMWLHEGFGTYMQALYVERLRGTEGMLAYMATMRPGIANQRPVAPRESQTAGQIYFTSGGDIYSKGALVLHTLRYLVGDEAFFTTLRRMAYPDPALERVTDGSHVRFATTEAFRRIAEEASGMELGWYFETYLRQPALPRLAVEPAGEGWTLRWENPAGVPFPMPVDVQVGRERRRIAMPDGQAHVEVPGGRAPVIDPDRWILRAVAAPEAATP